MLTWLRYICSLGLLPWVVRDGRRLKQSIPSLDEAPGDRSGVTAGALQTRHVLGFGESPIAAVGLHNQCDGVTVVVAQQIAQAQHVKVSWTVLGKSGIRLAELLGHFEGQMPENTDLVIVSIGVNDCKQGTSMRSWSNGLGRLLDKLRALYPEALIMCSALPPLGSFASLTWPVRVFLGARAALMNQVLANQVQRHVGVCLLAMPAQLPMDSFAADGFHPNELAHQRWAAALHRLYQDQEPARST